MSDFVQHVEMEGGFAVTTWDDDAPILGMQIGVFNWRLRKAREAKGWTRAELARQIGMSPGVVGDAEKLQRVSAKARWLMALALGVPEDVLFPGELDALPKDAPPQIELSMTREDVRALAEPDAHDDMIAETERQALSAQMASALEALSPREQRVIALRFGLDGSLPRTLEEVAGIEGVTRERTRQIEVAALRKLRHPRQSRPLRDYLPEYASGYFPKPLSGVCQRRDARGDCYARFEMPGWMKEARAGDLRRPMFLCGSCWARFLKARAEAV